MTRTLSLWILCLGLAGPLAAQTRPSTSGPPSVVASLFADAGAKETAVRKALTAASPAPTVLKAVRTVVADYEAVVRRFPSSGYSDDALWRAAQLSAEAFELFGDAKEQAVAIRLLQSLAKQYPSSKFAKQAPARVAAIKNSTPRPAAVSTAAAPAPTAPPPAGPAAVMVATAPAPPAFAAPVSTEKTATVKDIRRSALTDTVRIVIELDTEVSFHDERIENPSRVFVDLANARPGPTVMDQTLRFDQDGDLVRQVRVGRQANGATRIVLDATGISSYSVYPLYNPYRLVIDCIRQKSAPVAMRPPAPFVPATPGTLSRSPEPTSVAVPVTPTPTPAPVTPATPAALSARRAETMNGALPLSVASASAAIAEALAPPVIVPAAPAVTPLTPAVLAAVPEAPPPVPPSRNLAGGISIARQLGLGVSHIVIDPGHGGHDPGTMNGDTKEADLVLDIALRLEKLLTNVQGVSVTLTRRSDEFIPLQQRTAIANRENADLFLSIHTNANNSRTVQGVETYFLNFATNLSAAAVAARENAASGQSMGELPDVVKTIALNSKLDESRDFATYVQREMVSSLKAQNKTMKDLGVKQAPFVVLIGAAMPSVLAEVSFMTNPQDAKLLKSPAYRQKIAESLFEGVRKYQSSLKSVPTIATQ